MPDMAVKPFKNPSNIDILNSVRNRMTSDYQQRIPEATKGNINAVVDSLWEYKVARNDFTDALINLIGIQIIKNNTWTNPFARFKRGKLLYGESIEEIAVGLLNAYTYSAQREYTEKDIFGREPNEVQSRFHKIDRQNIYKLSVNTTILRQAFYAEGGLSQFLVALMSQINTSDQWDEFLLMTSLFRQYDDRNGFYRVNVPDLLSGSASADDAKQFLVKARELADTLTFLSRNYNAAKMPSVAQTGDLELFMTPRARAVMDVEALSAAFNVNSAELSSRVTVVPPENFNIDGCQAILTTKDFFVVADTVLEMETARNPVGLFQNYFWHHQGVYSVSPFVPAIMLTSGEGTESIKVDTYVTGIGSISYVDEDGATVTDLTRGNIYQILGSADVSPVGADIDGLRYVITGNTSSRTRVTAAGYLIIGYDETAPSLSIRAISTFDSTFYKDSTVNLTGPVIAGSLGLSVDEDVTTLTNTGLPVLTPNSGSVGTTFATNNGKWDQSPDSFTYQWQANGTDISGATQDTYTPVSGDAGKTITAKVTAVKSGFTSVTATTKGVTLS